MPLNIMTANTLGPPYEGPMAWSRRRNLLGRVLAASDADVIGLQETRGDQRDDLLQRMPGYRFLGRSHQGDTVGEHTGIMWRPDRVDLLENGDFWLSDTPDVPGTGTWGNPGPRVVTWARFAREGTRFVVVNSHFPYPEDDEGEAGRTRSAEALRATALQIAGVDPAILIGDFNTVPGSDAYRVLTDGFVDAASGGIEGPEVTYHAFTGQPVQGRLDWILVRGLEVHGVRSIDEHAEDAEGVYWPSDHYPVIATLSA